MVDRPEEHPWSSHRAYLGKEILPWLDTGTILQQLSRKERNARARFTEFVGERMTDGRREEFHGEKCSDNRIIGNNHFIEAVLAKAEALPEHRPDVKAVVEAVMKIYEIDNQRLRAPGQERVASEARSVAAWATLELSTGKLTELAKHVGREPSTLTCAVRRLEKRQNRDTQLAEKMERLRQSL